MMTGNRLSSHPADRCSPALLRRTRRPGAGDQPAPRGRPTPRSPIPGTQLPAPPPKFGGKIERTTEGSKPWWPARIVPPAGAPNVLLIMTDDSGYGVPSTFGGVIPTPALDRIAANGLRYTNFHSTALCSPTRAALITGRNHHSVGYGVIAEQATGLPRLRQLHHQGQGHDRHDPEGQRLPDLVVRQEPQHPGLPGDAPRARSTNGRPAWASNTSTGSWAATRTSGSPGNLARNTTYIYPFQGNPELQPHHRDGRRGDRVHEPGQYPDARPALLRLLRAGRDPRAAPPDTRVDQEDQRHASVRQGLERAARPDLREPEEARRHPAGRQADAVARRPAEALGGRSRPTSRRCSSARSTSSPRTSPTPTTRSAA